jgi:cysteine desulfurase
MEVYMDHGAAKPVDPRVLEEMMPYFTESYGNPASFHTEGFKAINALKKARGQVASLINANTNEIIFTSGATEANNLTLLGSGSRNKNRGNKIIISEIEHISVINISKELSRQGFEVLKCPVNTYGVIDLDEFTKLIDKKTSIVSIMLANGEIGSIQPIKEITKLAHDKGILVHTDATAAVGQIDIDVKELDVDLMTLSSNDLYGPKGVGAAFIKKGVRVKPVIIGGGQENGLRSGSENIHGIVGMGKAAELSKGEMREESQRLTELQNILIQNILKTVPESYLNGHPTNRLPNNINIRFSFIEGEALIMSLDDIGVRISSGSACAAKTLEPSHTLLACGLKHEEAHGSLVFTLGKDNNKQHVEYVIKELPGIVKRLRAMSPLTPKELK